MLISIYHSRIIRPPSKEPWIGWREPIPGYYANWFTRIRTCIRWIQRTSEQCPNSILDEAMSVWFWVQHHQTHVSVVKLRGFGRFFDAQAVSLLRGFSRFFRWNRSIGVCFCWLMYQFCFHWCFMLYHLSLHTLVFFFFCCWWSVFEPRTLHILCIVLPTQLSSRGHTLDFYYNEWIYLCYFKKN